MKVKIDFIYLYHKDKGVSGSIQYRMLHMKPNLENTSIFKRLKDKTTKDTLAVQTRPRLSLCDTSIYIANCIRGRKNCIIFILELLLIGSKYIDKKCKTRQTQG
jgi:hypothetical protein